MARLEGTYRGVARNRHRIFVAPWNVGALGNFTTGEQSQGALMLKTLLLSAALVGAGVIGAAAQSTTTPSAGGSVSAATHCKDASGQVKMKTAWNTPGSPTAGSSAGASSGAAERPAGGAPPASGSTGSGGSSGGMSGGASNSAANLPNC